MGDLGHNGRLSEGRSGAEGGSDDKGGHLLGIVDAEIYLKKQEAENIRKLKTYLVLADLKAY